MPILLVMFYTIWFIPNKVMKHFSSKLSKGFEESVCGLCLCLTIVLFLAGFAWLMAIAIPDPGQSKIFISR